MTVTPLAFAIMVALSASPQAFADGAPMATLDASTMLFQMLSEGSVYANTLDPFAVNGIQIDFGDDAQSGTLLDELLQGR